MIWVVNKEDLSYYTSDSDTCYCEAPSHASDILLQGKWVPFQSGFNYATSVEVWSVDGETALEVVDPSYYSLYYGVIPDTGEYYFTIRLKAFSPAMCANKCFLIRVGVSYNNVLPTTYVFAAWTERYCIKSCCDVPRGITVNGDTVTYTAPDISQGECNRPLIRILAYSDCYNVFNGKYYGKPSSYSGTYEPFFDIHVFEGKIVDRPRSIVKQQSYNCKIQKVETFNVFLLKGHEFFPSWKMREIEDSASGNHFFVDDYRNYREYQVQGTLFEKIGETLCPEVFKLNAEVTECVRRQIFGCVTNCEDNGNQGIFFVVPYNYDEAYFFNSNGNIIAQDIDELLQWFISHGLQAELMGSVPCQVGGIIKVTGNPIPPVVYYNGVSLQTQIVPLSVDFTDICDYIPNAGCNAPVLGTFVYADLPCDAPVLGTFVYSDVTGTSFELIEETPWIMDDAGSAGSVFGASATIMIKVAKDETGLTGSFVTITGEVIGTMEIAGIPPAGALITSGVDVLGNLDAGWEIYIDTLGNITFNGTITFLTDNILRIELTNLNYSL